MNIHHSNQPSYEELSEKWQTTFDVIKAGTWEYLVDEEKFIVSNEWLRLLGYAPEKQLSDQNIKQVFELIHPDDVESLRSSVKKCIEGSNPDFNHVHRLKTCSGKWLWVMGRARLATDHGKRLIGVDIDFTEQNEIRERLAASLEKAEMLLELKEKAKKESDEANRAKTTFLATISHEIRTPLNAIAGFSKLLGDEGQLNDSQAEVLAIINNSCDHLLSLVNDVMVWGRIELGNLTITNQQVNLESLLSELTTLFHLQAERKNLEFRVNIQPGYPRMVETDPTRLKQLCLNLLNNAFEHTNEGFVTLNMLAESKDDRECILKFSICDSGKGVKPEEIDSLFNAFEQGSNSNRAGIGAGLGLYICKSIVELLGGEIKLTNSTKQGSCFEFAIPVKPVGRSDVQSSLIRVQEITRSKNGSMQYKSRMDELPHPDAKKSAIPARAISEKKLSILVVDDNPANQKLLEKQLGKIGCHCELAGNGEEAISRWMEDDFDLILADCAMPVMDGFKMARSIRQAANGKENVPIFAISGSAEEYKNRCMDAGMNLVLSKPLSINVLAEAISDYFPPV